MDELKLTTRRKGHKVCVLVGTGDSTSTKYALRMTKAFFHPDTDELHLVCSIMTEDSRAAAEMRLLQMVDRDLQHCTRNHVVVKEDDYTMYESLARYLAQAGFDLILLGSSSLCTPPLTSKSPAPSSRSGQRGGDGPNTQGQAVVTPSGLGSIALKILTELLALRNAPVMVVKVNTRGSFLTTTGSNSLKVMVDLQANSRHVLEWLFEVFEPGRDHLTLTVSQAYDAKNNPKPLAQRLLTAFSVQAAVNSFEADKHLFKEPSNKSLPQAVAEVEPDVLVVQAPRCKGLPPQLTEVLYGSKTSILIWPATNGVP